jgi:hypothetical protein
MKHALPALLLALTSACSLSGGEVDPDPPAWDPQSAVTVSYNPNQGSVHVETHLPWAFGVFGYYDGAAPVDYDQRPLSSVPSPAETYWMANAEEYHFGVRLDTPSQSMAVYRVGQPDYVLVSFDDRVYSRCPTDDPYAVWRDCGDEHWALHNDVPFE